MKYFVAFVILATSACNARFAGAVETISKKFMISTATMTLLDLPFKRVDVTGGTLCLLFFKDVAINGELKDVYTELDSVDVVLNNIARPYTTINLYDAGENYDGWISANKLTIVVGNHEDFLVWQKYLEKLKKDREAYRKAAFGPVRVLPPK